MHLERIVNSCGAGFLAGLYSSYTPDSLKLMQEQIIKAKREGLEIWNSMYKEGGHNYPVKSWGMLLALTSDIQVASHPLLNAFGFKAFSKFTNPIHKSNLILWGLDLNTVTEDFIKGVKLP